MAPGNDVIPDGQAVHATEHVVPLKVPAMQVLALLPFEQYFPGGQQEHNPVTLS